MRPLVQSILFSWIVLANAQHVDFDTSMQLERYAHEGCLTAVSWGPEVYNFLKTQYEKTAPDLIKASEKPKIPKIIHQIWIGDQPIPEHLKQYMATWQKLHPDWTYILWDNEKVAHLFMHNRDLFEEAWNWSHKSDILRYELLYHFGGWYADVDFECLKPLDELCYLYDFCTGIQPLDTAYVQLGAALTGSVPMHPLVEHLIESLRLTRDDESIIIKAGPIFFTKYTLEYFDAAPGVNVILPASYFYPRGYLDPLEDRATWQKPESYAAHHWAGTWLHQEKPVKAQT